MTEQVCPKCGRPFIMKCDFGGFEDCDGVVAMVAHGKTVMHGLFGDFEQYTDRCFLNKEQWEKIK